MKRRPFLLSTGAAVLGAGIARAQKAPGKKLGWALVGLGKLSTHQLGPALKKAKHSQLTAVVTGTPEKGVRWRKEYGLGEDQVYTYEDFDKIIDNPDIDVVYIVLPNSMHAEFSIRAAKAGKHVFCEKPMANTAEDCRQMIAACEEADRRLGIAYRCQFTPQHLEAIRFTKEEVFGRPMHIEAGFCIQLGGDPSQWRLNHKLAGGGALMDVGIYALQACRYLTGEEPIEISAQEVKTDRERFAEVDESIQWMMKFPSGVTANCTTSYAYKGLNKFTVYGKDGRFGMEPAYSYGNIKGWTSQDEIAFPTKQVDQFGNEMDVFSQAILNQEDFKASGQDGLKDLIAIEAIYRSIKEGKKVTL